MKRTRDVEARSAHVADMYDSDGIGVQTSANARLRSNRIGRLKTLFTPAALNWGLLSMGLSMSMRLVVLTAAFAAALCGDVDAGSVSAQKVAMQDASLQESMGPVQDREREKLLPTDRAIVLARRMLYEAATGMATDAEPPALDAKKQRVRAAGVLLDRQTKPQDWAKRHLADGLNEPVYTI